MQATTKKLYAWAIHKAESTKAPLWLGLLFLLEIVLFIPLDAVLIFFCLQQRRRIALYVLIATLASTLSALGGYFLGYFLWDLINSYIIPHFMTQAAFDKVAHQLDKYEHWAIVLGALLPLPLKVISLVTGVFNLGAATLAGCVAGARFVRFALIGGAMAFFGEKLKSFVDRHFHRLFLLVGAKVAIVSGFVWFLAN